MKNFISLLAILLLLTASPIASLADDLSSQALQGKWLFTHILMDGGSSEIKVNREVEFLPDGSAVNYDAVGEVRSRGTFTIADNTIIYEDENGKQNWKLVSFEGNKLHVDHRGAEMFFEKQ